MQISNRYRRFTFCQRTTISSFFFQNIAFFVVIRQSNHILIFINCTIKFNDSFCRKFFSESAKVPHKYIFFRNQQIQYLHRTTIIKFNHTPSWYYTTKINSTPKESHRCSSPNRAHAPLPNHPSEHKEKMYYFISRTRNSTTHKTNIHTHIHAFLFYLRRIKKAASPPLSYLGRKCTDGVAPLRFSKTPQLGKGDSIVGPHPRQAPLPFWKTLFEFCRSYRSSRTDRTHAVFVWGWTFSRLSGR